jgi:anti-anti-sigma factor
MSAAEQAQPTEGLLYEPPGSITVVNVNDAIAAIDLRGEFDLAQAPQITEVARRLFASRQDVVINLSDATFIDSAFVHALFAANDDALEQQRSLVVQVDSESRVARVLAITGADRDLATAPTRKGAIELIEQDVAGVGGPDAR